MVPDDMAYSLLCQARHCIYLSLEYMRHDSRFDFLSGEDKTKLIGIYSDLCDLTSQEVFPEHNKKEGE